MEMRVPDVDTPTEEANCPNMGNMMAAKWKKYEID